MDARDVRETIEKILFRRALEHRLEGYTLDTAIEISEALKPGTLSVKPLIEARPFSNSCNLHDNCANADAQAKAKGNLRASHCHDECCEDCFGC